jgi:alkylhydroperoxidase family enzyme
MTRLPFPDLAAAPQPLRDTLAALPFDLAVVRMFAHAPEAFEAWLRFGGAVLGQNGLERDVQELAICVVTAVDSPRYEYVHHRQQLLAAGFTGEQVAVIERGELRSASLSEPHRAVAVFASEVRANVRASDAALSELRRHFTDRQVIELILCIGLYMLNSRVAENAGVTLEDDRVFAKPGQSVPEATPIAPTGA